ncbi:hypothetical protein [Chitiniphilus eburneus]|uniref:DUF4852 domain-containing protein n=1 Tax=Chitiniphilus eburneus TaxID=2571148 RepID=A0A4U0PXA4_9NEIS|nr:hypothetical protein [Chitiniphilus eburneus]TJZ73201.1 hypothetical protein FAZ21_11325 [Chitiniphilus eburneus]
MFRIAVVSGLVVALSACHPATPVQPAPLAASARESAPVRNAASYPLLDDQAGLMALYYGQARLPVPYERMAEAMSNDYRETSNSFQRRSLLDALTPQIDALLTRWQSQSCFSLKSRVSFSHFDLNQRVFRVSGLEAPMQFAFESGRYAIVLNNPPPHEYRPASEQLARRIEDVITRNGATFAYPVTLRLCARGVRDIADRNLVVANLEHADVLDLTKNPLPLVVP